MARAKDAERQKNNHCGRQIATCRVETAIAKIRNGLRHMEIAPAKIRYGLRHMERAIVKIRTGLRHMEDVLAKIRNGLGGMEIDDANIRNDFGHVDEVLVKISLDHFSSLPSCIGLIGMRHHDRH